MTDASLPARAARASRDAEPAAARDLAVEFRVQP
jgi:hypothetical protein